MKREMNKLKILFVASSYNVGLPFHLTRLAIALRRKGHDVIVVSDIKEEIQGLSKELKSEFIKHYRIMGLDNFSNLKSVWELSKILKAEDIDVIHVFGIIKLVKFYLLNLLTVGKKKPIILTMDSIRDKTALRKICYIVSRLILNSYVNMIVPVSNWTKKRLSLYGVKREKLFTIHNAIDLEYFDSDVAECLSLMDFFEGIKDKTLITQVSTLNPWKGHEYLLEAARRVLAVRSDVHFLIVGGGPSRQKLSSLVHDLGISKKVTFTGQVQNQYIPWILSHIDIGVLASLRENCPRILLEYMAARKPIVATKVGGVPEIVIEGVNGYIVQPADANLMAEAILKLIDIRQAALKMKIEGRRIVEEDFSMNIFTSKLESVYELATVN